MRKLTFISTLLGFLAFCLIPAGSAVSEEAVFITPSAFVSALAPLVSDGIAKGYTVGVKTVEDIEATYPGATRRDKIQAAVLDLRNNGMQMVTFVGDASYDDGGGSYEPEFDMIPMFYYYNPEIGYWRDHRATLVDYVDFNGDRKPDIIPHVIPAQTAQDVINFVNHELEYGSYNPLESWLNNALWLVCDADISGNRGERVRELADSLRRDPAMPGFNHIWKCESEIPGGGSYFVREAEYINAVDAGVGVLFALGSSSSRTSLVDFAIGHEDWGNFDVDSHLAENHRLGVYFALNCGLGEYDRKEGTCCGRDFLSQNLFAAQYKGAAAWIAPTSNVRYLCGFLLGRALMQQMYQYGARTTGEAFFGALRRVMQDYPLFQDIWECYNFYGSMFHVTHGMVQTVTGVDDIPKFANGLKQNYPNPFNPVTTIQYSTKGSGTVSLRVYNVAGQLVRTLVSGEQTPGLHVARWEGTDNQGHPVASGVYFYKLRTKDFTKTKKMVLLK